MDLKQALETLESHQWCSLRVITAHLKKGTGGKVLELPKCRLATKQSPVILSMSKGTLSRELVERSKSHQNFTRNIELANSQRIITIHPILITHINNQALV